MVERNRRLGYLSLVVLGVVALILCPAFRSRRSRAPTPAREAALRERSKRDAAEIIKAQEVLQEYADIGFVRKTDMPAGRIWVNPLLWLVLNRDQKEGFIEDMALAHQTLAGSSVVEILSYADDQKLGQHGGLGTKILK